MGDMEETEQIAALFAMADMARKEADATIGKDDLEEEEDPASYFVNAPERRTSKGRAVCVSLPDGDYHMCFGVQCEHLTLDHERQLVCTISGMVVGVDHTREHGASWMTRSVGSIDPDDTAGTPLGGWIRRRDMFSASVSAYRSAASISDATVFLSPRQSYDNEDTDTGGLLRHQKRGALCVDELPIETEPSKRARSGRRAWTREVIEKLRLEASHVVSSLFIVAYGHTQTKHLKLDPRLQNIEFVRTLALRRYVRACVDGRQELNADVLHNVCVHANEFVRAQRQQASDQTADTASRHLHGRGPGFSGQVRNLVSNLIVSLWRAACATPHMRANKRGNDSFRPFAAGVLYSFKRGVYLTDGTCVVPELEALAIHLPALRSSHSTVLAKQLQSSSHRGICSFHHSISSMESMEVDETIEIRRLFSDAAGQAAFLRALVHQSSAQR